tara:strand:- start:820 stop:2133 length:1314 start_codon:yes stop_codon:yes gene_type:complete
MDISVTSERIALSGEVKIPGDKSISHRAILCSALARSQSTLENLQKSEDVLNTLKAIQQLGIEVKQTDYRYEILGNGLNGLKKPKDSLYFGNSGTGIRLASGILAWQNFETELNGDSSLAKRPMKRISEPLISMGANIVLSEDNTPPIKISGNLNLSGISYEMPIASAQVKSAILFASLNAKGKTLITEPLSTRNHTELMFKQLGLDIEMNGNKITFNGQNEFEGIKFKVPGDFSSAAFLIVAALITPGSSILIKDVGLNSTRIALLEVLKSMNANIEINNKRKVGEEDIGDIAVSHSDLIACTVTSEVIPNLIDELPILFIASLFAEGDSKFLGVEELKYKESDRLFSMQEGLRNLGIETEYKDDIFLVEGRGAGYLLRDGQVDSFGDHRIAMSFIVAGLRAKKEIKINNTECIKTSYPEFIEQMSSLGAILNESR